MISLKVIVKSVEEDTTQGVYNALTALGIHPDLVEVDYYMYGFTCDDRVCPIAAHAEISFEDDKKALLIKLKDSKEIIIK